MTPEAVVQTLIDLAGAAYATEIGEDKCCTVDIGGYAVGKVVAVCWFVPASQIAILIFDVRHSKISANTKVRACMRDDRSIATMRLP